MSKSDSRMVTNKKDTDENRDVQGSIVTKTSAIFPVLVGFRVINSLLTRTYFQADEFWQSLEPAHYKAFGYGELTWEWKVGLRSYAFPMLFEIIYRLVKLLAIASKEALSIICSIGAGLMLLCFPQSKLATEVARDLLTIPNEYSETVEYYGVIYAPKLFMALLAATGEYFTIKFIQKVYLKTVSKNDDQLPKLSNITKIALLLTLTNFFNCFFITRTFINSFEMILTSIALYNWDWSGGIEINTRSFTKSLFFAMFACIQRPSNAIIWIVLGFFLTINLLLRRDYTLIGRLYAKILVVFTITMLVNVVIDFYFYNQIIFPVFKFINFNFTSILSEFYGVAPWHFHLLQSLPIMLGYSLPLFIYGLFSNDSTTKNNIRFGALRQIKFVLILNIIFYSYLQHKEFRFIYPLQPLFCLLSALGALKLAGKVQNYRYLKEYVWIIPLMSMIVSIFIITFQESGVIQVMKDLHNEKDIDSVGFVMPCHSTPWQSYLHRNDIRQLWAISCEPPLHLLGKNNASIELQTYMDESDYLYENISGFIKKNFPKFTNSMDMENVNNNASMPQFPHEWPQFLIIFEQLDNEFMSRYLLDSGYVKYNKIFNSYSHWDSRRNGDLIIYYKNN